MSHFKDVMSKRSNDELLQITKFERKDYQEEALLAAELELLNRNLSEIQISEAYRIIEQKKQELLNRKIKVENYKNKSIEILGNVNPYNEKMSSEKKIILSITFFFSLVWVIEIISQFDLLVFIFSNDNESKFDYSMILYFFPFFFIPISVYLFYVKNKIGWFLLVFYSIFNVCFTFYFIASLFSAYFDEIDKIVFFLPSPNPATILGAFIFYIIILLVICQSKILEVYRIQRKTMFETILYTLGLILVIWYFM